MKRIGPVVDVLVCVVFVVVCPILASTSVNKDEPGDGYARKTEGSAQTSGNSKESKLFPHRDGDHDPTVKGKERQGKVNGDNSALGRFLEDVLRAQGDLRWIDQAVRGVNREKDWEKSPSARTSKYSESSRKEGTTSLPVNVHRGAKSREKRGFDQNYETLWTGMKKKYDDKSPSEIPQRIYLDNQIPVKRVVDFDYSDGSGKEVPTSLENKAGGPVYDKGPMDDQIPKDWTKTEDICSLNDWLNSKEPATEQEKQGDRWIRDYEAAPSDLLNSNTKLHDAQDKGRSEKDEAKKDEAPTLESLKETVLELKKSLDEAGKKEHGDSKNADSAKEKVESKDRRTRGKNKHNRNEKDEEDSGWWEASEPGNMDLKKREQATRELVDRNARLKVWRTKRTEEVNNDDGNPKLFHRAGFGEPYPDERALKELHDRKRRSKGTTSNEKRYLNETPNKGSSESDDKNFGKVSKESSCSNADDSAKKDSSSNDFQGTLPNDVQDSSKGAPGVQREVNGNAEGSGNYEQSDLSQKDSNNMGNKLTKEEGKPAFDSIPTKTSSGLNTADSEQAEEARPQKLEENQENVGSDKTEQVAKVFEPQSHLYENDERSNEVLEKDPGKLSRQVSDEKRSAKGAGNINILLQTEKKNLLKFSNAGPNDKSLANGQQPFVMNRFDVKKKLIMEEEEQPGKSVATILNVKIQKAQVDTAAEAKPEDTLGGDSAKLLDRGKNKPNEVLYKEAAGLRNDLKQRNADEELLKNSAEFDKGSVESDDNEGERSWYEGVPRNQMGMSIDQSGAEKYKEEGEKEKFGNEEERFRDGRKKGGSIEVSNDGGASSDASSAVLDDKVKDDLGGDRNRIKEIFIMTDGMDDGKMNDRYVQRRMLQYMEYSNDDAEDADASYSDKEEEEEEDRQAEAAGKFDVEARRKERSPSAEPSKGNPVKAKVNVLIKEKLNKDQKKNHRERRNSPTIIEYYEYDSDMAPDRDTASAASDQEPGKSNYDRNAVDSNLEQAESMEDLPVCVPVGLKKGEHEEDMLNEGRKQEKTKNKGIVEHFITVEGVQPAKNVTERAGWSSSSRLSSKAALAQGEGSLSDQQPGRLDQGEDNANSINQGRSAVKATA
ncbi:uncharacterized protein LOC143374908 [Andrena cerasifolii]|uniref:uncharacterized protein LOC143374908 n=1 Tax=Andrena cerasifolii TaxID=2819439 RepID=UPI004037F06F